MSKPFSPGFKNLRKDTERCLQCEGKREKNDHGQTVFRGYPEALDRVFRLYVQQRAWAPPVAKFRKWNWEWSYNGFLDELTGRLVDAREWDLLKGHWAGVIAKRRTTYNKTRQARKTAPGEVSEDLVTKTRELLLDSLGRLLRYALEVGKESEIGECLDIVARVEKRLKA